MEIGGRKSVWKENLTIIAGNGGEYLSRKFKALLKKEGFRHELTILKTPEQTGVTELVNRTLMKMTRSTLYNTLKDFGLRYCQQLHKSEIDAPQAPLLT